MSLFIFNFSVLADYHNDLIDLLETEMKCENENGFGPMEDLINEVSSKEVSVLQIMYDDAGVITLNDHDYSYIEKLCRASLISQKEYFPTLNVPLTFDFLYVQSYIIRKHFLRCRINYRHIAQKYQWYVRRVPGATTTTDDIETFDLDEKYTVSLSHQQLESDWNHLKEMPLDKLYHSHRLFRQIVLILKDQENDRSADNLYEFIESIDDDNNDLRQQIEQYEIKNFKLCYIDHVRKLYKTSIEGFEYLFTDVSDLLRVSINTALNTELIQMFDTTLINIDYGDQIENINKIIQTITDFLNDLKDIEDTLLQKSTQSLSKTCEYIIDENPILKLIPENIKCENYVPLNIYLIKVRSSLQERILNIKEKEVKFLWDEDFSTNSQHRSTSQQNRFQNYLNAENGLISADPQDGTNEDEWNVFPMNNDDSNYNISDNDLLFNEVQLSIPQNHVLPIDNQILDRVQFEDEINYSVSVQLLIKTVPLTSSIFNQKMHEERQKIVEKESVPTTKAQRFLVTYPDGKTVGHLWRNEKLYEQFRKVFQEKKYDSDTLVVVDKDQIFIDFMNNNSQPSHQISLEYHIIKKDLLIQIQFKFKTKIFEYMVTSGANVSTVINHFIHDNNLQSISPEIYLNFSDEFGKCINCETIADISANKLINIIVTEENTNDGTLCEVTLHPNEGNYY